MKKIISITIIYNKQMATTTPYGYATDIHVGSALPNEMNYALPASLPASKNFEIRVQPKFMG